MIKPSDCLSVKDKATLNELEIKVDNYLRNTYDGSRRLNLSHVINIREGKIRNEICKRYRDVGWFVTFEPCNQGGQHPSGPYFHTESE
jgi:hypothetical protein